MPDDPNRHVEDQLAAWARKRREEAGAPFALHPATRKLLQDEIGRTFPNKSDDRTAAPVVGWRLLWPRFALAGGLCVLLVAVVGILLPGLAKSKSKGQQIALVRPQEKLISPDSAERDASIRNAPDSGGAVQTPAPRHRDEAAKPSGAEARTPSRPSFPEDKPLDAQARSVAVLEDARMKAEQPAKEEALWLADKDRQPILAEKSKAAAPAGTAPPGREPSAEKEQVLLHQRSDLGAAPASRTTHATAPANSQKAPASAPLPRVEAPPITSESASIGQRVGGVGGRSYGGAASNTATGANLAYNRPQNGAKANEDSLALARQIRPATDGIASLPEQRATDRFGTGSVYSYAAVPPSQQVQRFAQQREYRLNLNSPPMPNVLTSFQLLQNGQQIRVVDTDGSIYDGGIEPSPAAATATRATPLPTTTAELKKGVEPEAKRRLAATAAEETLASQNAFFRVTGTNITLNQPVVFEGNFLSVSNPTNEIRLGTKLDAGQSAAAAGRQSSPQKSQQMLNTQIRGQATIGSSNRIEINAAPVPE